MSNRALFRHYPSTRQIPHLDFANLPTPVETLGELENQMQIPSLQVKRDDLTAGQYGGNKVRKLEFLLADARAKGHSGADLGHRVENTQLGTLPAEYERWATQDLDGDDG